MATIEILPARRRAFSLLEAVVALSLSSLIIGALGLMLVYASRTLTQSMSYNTVQQQAILAMRRVCDDLTRINIYSLYSVGNPAVLPPFDNRDLNPVSGVNATFLSPNNTTLVANRDIFSYTNLGAPPRSHLDFRTWVGLFVDANSNLVRSEIEAAAPINLTGPNPPIPTVGRPLLADYQNLAVLGLRAKVICRGISTTDTAGIPVVDGFQVRTDPAVPGSALVKLHVREAFGTGAKAYHQLHFQSRVYARNTDIAP